MKDILNYDLNKKLLNNNHLYFFVKSGFVFSQILILFLNFKTKTGRFFAMVLVRLLIQWSVSFCLIQGGMAMLIAKGPFKRIHQSRALTRVIQAHLFNRITSKEAKVFYLALLNLENYSNRLVKGGKRKRRG
nr:hypothetical protein [Providencia huaxiensis]